ncbi:GNAT family N-acetyltransferase [Salinibaculum rarum]|uniref:GNAT family N-acetyltransferase n=1 Tax=Salinibaculum rarum TaxID=3058903 RepID=UPI00265FCA05|nr:GNAT family N-acetyltransferase [Salinibaculum sp. KK48]
MGNSLQIATHKLGPRDITDCLDLWVDRMADGYQDPFLLRNCAAYTPGYCGRIAEHTGTFTGFAAGHIGTLASELSIPYNWVADQVNLDSTATIAYADIACVKPVFEHRGIGTELLRELTTQLYKHDGVDVIVAEVWEHTAPTAARILEAHDYEQQYYSDTYWEYATQVGHEPCPACGSTPCDCAGSLYTHDRRH